MNTKTYFESLPTWGDMGKMSVGYEDMFSRLQSFVEKADKTASNFGYPPYNIKKVDDNHYLIEMAVAGFAKQEIDVVLEDGKLTIQGNSSSDDDGTHVLWKGISNRAFTRTFTLADTIEVHNAELINGMLKIWLENIIPEHKKPKKIDIKSSEETSSEKEFLAE